MYCILVIRLLGDFIADSENVEGKFYLWNSEEIRKTLPTELQAIALSLFNVNEIGNFPEAIQNQNGKNILHLKKSLTEVADEFKISLNKVIINLGRTRLVFFK